MLNFFFEILQNLGNTSACILPKGLIKFTYTKNKKSTTTSFSFYLDNDQNDIFITMLKNHAYDVMPYANTQHMLFQWAHDIFDQYLVDIKFGQY